MRFVPIKSIEQQVVLCIHRIREGWKAERTATINRLRGLLLEFGVAFPQAPERLRRELAIYLSQHDQPLPEAVKRYVQDLLAHIDTLEERMAEYDRLIAQQVRASEPARRIAKVRGIGALTASAAVATVGDAREFRNGRQLAAWLGLVPRQHSSGGKVRLGHITRRGDIYLRTLLVQGARSALQAALQRDPLKQDRIGAWMVRLFARVGYHKALVAIANKHARILWALLSKGKSFNPALPA